MGAVESDGTGVKSLDHFEALDQRRPTAAGIARLVHAAARHRKAKMRRVARIGDGRTQLRTIGCDVQQQLALTRAAAREAWISSRA
jgi:hypothetical protein